MVIIKGIGRQMGNSATGSVATGTAVGSVPGKPVTPPPQKVAEPRAEAAMGGGSGKVAESRPKAPLGDEAKTISKPVPGVAPKPPESDDENSRVTTPMPPPHSKPESVRIAMPPPPVSASGTQSVSKSLSQLAAEAPIGAPINDTSTSPALTNPPQLASSSSEPRPSRFSLPPASSNKSDWFSFAALVGGCGLAPTIALWVTEACSRTVSLGYMAAVTLVASAFLYVSKQAKKAHINPSGHETGSAGSEKTNGGNS